MTNSLDRSVALRFGAVAATYDQQAGVQRMVATTLADMLVDVGPVQRILEVGCGTGLLTARLAGRFPDAAIDALDISESVIKRARERMAGNQRVRWLVMDVRLLPTDKRYSLIVSSSAMHWITPLDDLINRLAAVLEPGGDLVFALMLNGTLGELHAARSRVVPHKPTRARLPESEHIANSLNSSALQVVCNREETLRVSYESATEFLSSIHAQGVTGGAVSSSKVLLNRSELRRLAADYDKHYAAPNGGVFASYRILYVKAKLIR